MLPHKLHAGVGEAFSIHALTSSKANFRIGKTPFQKISDW
jgi:hypothetical protein